MAAPATETISHGEIIEYIPALRAFARTLTRNSESADDLVQETLTKAIANIEKFKPGTNLRAWLFTIQRNTFYTWSTKAAREKPGLAACASETEGPSMTVSATQEWSARGQEVMAAVQTLPPHYREALVLSLMLGETYEDCARICGCAIGTIKSRINRARQMVIAELGEDEI